MQVIRTALLAVPGRLRLQMPHLSAADTELHDKPEFDWTVEDLCKSTRGSASFGPPLRTGRAKFFSMSHETDFAWLRSGAM